MKYIFPYTVLVGLIICCLGCKRTTTTTIDTEPLDPISEVPEIELLEVAPLSVTQFVDSISFKIKYLDGDGDLGEPDPDNKTIFLVDNRAPNELIFDFHLSPRAPLDSEIVIQGELDIVLNNTILIDDDLENEMTTFSIYLLDRAGNQSNILESPEVLISR